MSVHEFTRSNTLTVFGRFRAAFQVVGKIGDHEDIQLPVAAEIAGQGYRRPRHVGEPMVLDCMFPRFSNHWTPCQGLKYMLSKASPLA